MIEDLNELPTHRHKHVEDILNDTFRYRNSITDRYFVSSLWGKYPLLWEEREKRRHRKYYRAKQGPAIRAAR